MSNYPARTANLRALCSVLETKGLLGTTRQAPAFGPSLTPERLRSILSGSTMPDFLARSVEHIMCVPWKWLDEPHNDVVEATRHLLVEQAMRTHTLEPANIPSGVGGA